MMRGCPEKSVGCFPQKRLAFSKGFTYVMYMTTSNRPTTGWVVQEITSGEYAPVIPREGGGAPLWKDRSSHAQNHGDRPFARVTSETCAKAKAAAQARCDELNGIGWDALHADEDEIDRRIIEQRGQAFDARVQL